MRPKFKSFAPAAASLTGFASNITGATVTLTATACTDGLAHQVSIRNDSASDHSSKTALLTGTDADKKTITETVTLPGPSATVESTAYFATLTSVVLSATIGADTMDIGWVDEFVSNTIPYDVHGGVSGVQVDITGTINYTLEYTTSDLENDSTFVFNEWNDSNVVSSTVSGGTNVAFSVMGIRLKVNSYSTGATAKLAILQSNA